MLLLVMCCLAAISAVSGEGNYSYRLPGDVLPELYDLRILTNIADKDENYTFSGDVAIKVKVVEGTNKIVLHSRNLLIDEPSVRIIQSEAAPGAECRGDVTQNPAIQVTQQTYYQDLDYYMIHTEPALQAGQTYVVCIPFSGELTAGLAGYYRSSYKDHSTGETRWLAVTQFESTDARRAFPSFDEPAMKAKFLVTIGHAQSKSAISNMPLSTTQPIEGMEGWVWDKFEETVPMSTYLLAFMVSDLEYEPSPRLASNKVAFRIWARKEAKHQVKFAAQIGPQVLEDYENYFDIKYPLPKQDMVAVPDFSAGAMENWGLITYRETALLFDPKTSSAVSQPYVVSVIAHEIAHQWFGNLVTMRWWTDLWLNEGFATYMATQEVHKLFPDWNTLDSDAVSNLKTVFTVDALKSSHPISLPIGHPREIAQIFDKISYKKGSYILRMLNRFLGEDAFRTGVSNYLKKHAFGNAEQNDLWDSLTLVAHQLQSLPGNTTVKQIMDTWTLQTGYPVLTVTRDYAKGTATIRQDRYFAEVVDSRKADNTTWWVPLTYTTASELNFTDTAPRTWLPADQREIQISNLPESDWVIFNIQLAGLYRIKYDMENWRKLMETLNSDSYGDISVLNRVQLIDDSMNLAKSGDVDYAVPLGILQYLKREVQYLPWSAAFSAIGQLNHLLEGKSLYGPFKSYVKSIVSPLYNYTSKQTYEDTPKNLQNIKLQNLALSWACKLNVADCRAKAVHLFRQWMAKANPDQDNPVPKNSRAIVYCYGVKEGGEDEWNFAWRRYLTSNEAKHKSDLLSSLGCSNEAWLLNRLLRWSIDEKSGIKLQDSTNVFLRVASSDLGYFLAKAFFTENIAEIHKYHGSKTARLSSYFDGISSKVSSQSELDELMEFTQKYGEYLKGSSQGVKQTLENANIRVMWQARYYNSVSRLLADPNDNIIPATA